MIKMSLIVGDGIHKGKEIPITKSQFLIGRDPACHLRPASPSISKQHCILQNRGDRAVLQDLGSTNGTFVNETQVKSGELELHDADTLKIGPLSFQVKITGGVAAGKPTPPPQSAASEADDLIASMLLDVQGESGPTVVDPNKLASDSTVLDMVPTADTATDAGKKPTEKKDPKKASFEANTSQAAKAILDKYLRRPRT